ncbi:MAG: hypothetical protein ACREJM_14525, partial [Candidatus Saccharimonadales bacterium]
SDELNFALECWGERVIARALLCAEGLLHRQLAVDTAWQAAEEAGLVDAFGPDEIQAAMALAFGSAR